MICHKYIGILQGTYRANGNFSLWSPKRRIQRIEGIIKQNSSLTRFLFILCGVRIDTRQILIVEIRYRLVIDYS